MININDAFQVDYLKCRNGKIIEIGDRIKINNTNMVVYKILKIPCVNNTGHNDTIYYWIYELTGFDHAGKHKCIKFIDADKNNEYIDSSDIQYCLYFSDVIVYHKDTGFYMFDLEQKLAEVKNQIEKNTSNMYTNAICTVISNKFAYNGPSSNMIFNIFGKNVKCDENNISNAIFEDVLGGEKILQHIADILSLEDEKYIKSEYFKCDVLSLIRSTLRDPKYSFDIDMENIVITKSNFDRVVLKAKDFFIDSNDVFKKCEDKKQFNGPH